MSTSNATVPSLQQFYSTIKDKGLRTVNQFSIEFPSNAGFTSDMAIFAQSANLPGRQILAEAAPYFGFPFKIITNLTYTQDWTLTVRCDTELKIRSAFEAWADTFASLRNNTGGKKGQAPGGSDCLVHLLKNDMVSVVKTYKLFGAFCQDLGAMDFDHAGTAIATFPVTIGFQYWNGADAGEVADPLG